MSDVLILNGPNLGRLGIREPAVYGTTSYEEFMSLCQDWAEAAGMQADVRQTNDEAELVAWIHNAADSRTPVILNPAAFTHYSYSLRDACAQLTVPLIEVHMSNPAGREEFRHTSVISGVATGTIAGFGVLSYYLALQALVRADQA